MVYTVVHGNENNYRKDSHDLLQPLQKDVAEQETASRAVRQMQVTVLGQERKMTLDEARKLYPDSQERAFFYCRVLGILDAYVDSSLMEHAINMAILPEGGTFKHYRERKPSCTPEN